MFQVTETHVYMFYFSFIYSVTRKCNHFTRSCFKDTTIIWFQPLRNWKFS